MLFADSPCPQLTVTAFSLDDAGLFPLRLAGHAGNAVASSLSPHLHPVAAQWRACHIRHLAGASASRTSAYPCDTALAFGVRGAGRATTCFASFIRLRARCGGAALPGGSS